MAIKLTRNDFSPYFRQTLDYVFLDEIEIEPGVFSNGKFLLQKNFWVFKWHFPNNPVFPGVFLMESMQQAGGLIINTLPNKRELPLFFYGAKEIKISKEARPGDLLENKVRLLSSRFGVNKFEGELFINGEQCCSMCFTLVAPKEMIA